MKQTPMTEETTDRVAALEAGSVALGLAALEVTARGLDTEGPDRDGDLNLTIRYAVTNPTAEDLEYLVIRTQLLTPEGLILDENRDTEQETLPAGGTTRLESSFWLKASRLGADPERVLVAIAVTGCDYGQRTLGELPVPEAPGVPVALPTVTLAPALRLVSGALWRAEPDRDGDCQVEVKGLVRNLTAQVLPEVTLAAAVTDKKGREVADAGTTEEVHPGALVTLSGSGYTKAHQLKGAQVALKLSGYWPVASGAWYGELEVRFRGRRPRNVPAMEVPAGLRLLCTGYMKRAWYHIREAEGMTVAERQDALRHALEEDFEGTIAGLINGDLDLEELDENFRQFIALPPEVTTVKPLAVRGDWEIEDEALVVNLEADWVLPLTARPEEEEEEDLQYALSSPAYSALYIRRDVEWLEFDNDSGGDASIEIEGDEE